MLSTQQKINDLKFDLLKGKLSLEEVFQKHIVDGNSYFFTTFLKDEVKEYKTKTLIADFLGVHISEVIFVGSAKLGYSLNPKSLFNEFDSKFNSTKIRRDKSDLDVAIVSNTLFNNIKKSVFDYTNAFHEKWNDNEYYFGERLEAFKVPICFKYFEYFTRGWFRPDMKPIGYEFCVKESFEELKRQLFQQFYRKTGIGIYQDWHFFKHYHISNLKNLSFRVKTETI